MEVVANIIATVWEYAAATMPDVDGTADSRVAAEDGMMATVCVGSSSNTAAAEVGVGGLRFVAQVEPSNTAVATWEQRGGEGAHNDEKVKKVNASNNDGKRSSSRPIAAMHGSDGVFEGGGISEVLAVESEHGVLADATADDTATTLASIHPRTTTTTTTTILDVPLEILLIILSKVDAKTLLITVPQVGTLWRNACQELDGVHLDLSWWTAEKKVPVEALVGWKQRTSTDGGAHSGRWADGLIDLFPRSTAVIVGDRWFGWDAVGDSGDLPKHPPKNCSAEITQASFGGYARLTDADVVTFADRCPGIRYANFSNCRNLTDIAVVCLAQKCPNIVYANFSNCRNLTDAAVIALANSCRGLQRITFNGCISLTDAALFALAGKCPGLQHTEFTGCRNLTDAAVVALAHTCPGLQYVEFIACKCLTDAAVIALAGNCRKITHVDFGGCDTLTDAALMAFADKCPGITYADFDYCDNVTDAAVIAFVGRCPGITHASFRSCNKLTNAAVFALAEMCPSITYADFAGCYNLTDRSVVLLAERCPDITYANFGDRFHIHRL